MMWLVAGHTWRRIHFTWESVRNADCLGLTLDLLNQNPLLNKIPGGVTCTFNFEEHFSGIVFVQ